MSFLPGHDAALAGLTMAKNVASKANMSAALAAATERSKEFASESVPHAAALAFQACKSKPGTAVACGATGVGLLLVAAPAIVAVPALGAVGFGTNGVIFGSAAASIQSGVGSVVAPSLFATLQSAGVGGYGAATVYGAIQVAGGAVVSSLVMISHAAIEILNTLKRWWQRDDTVRAVDKLRFISGHMERMAGALPGASYAKLYLEMFRLLALQLDGHLSATTVTAG